MTEPKDELRPRSYMELLTAVGERMDKDAIPALARYQAIREAGGTPKIEYSPHHGWVITDQSRQ